MRGFVSPGQLLTIDVKIEHEGSGFAVTSAKGRVGKELKCSAELTFRQIPFPDPAFRAHIDATSAKPRFPLQAMPHDSAETTRCQGSLDHRLRHRSLVPLIPLP